MTKLRHILFFWKKYVGYSLSSSNVIFIDTLYPFMYLNLDLHFYTVLRACCADIIPDISFVRISRHSVKSQACWVKKN